MPPEGFEPPAYGTGIPRAATDRRSCLIALAGEERRPALGPLGAELPVAQTVTFVAVTAAQLLALFNARSVRWSGFTGALGNPFLWVGLAITVALEAAALGIVPLRDVLGLTPLPLEGWLVAAALAPLPLLLTQTVRIIRERRSGRYQPRTKTGRTRSNHGSSRSQS